MKYGLLSLTVTWVCVIISYGAVSMVGNDEGSKKHTFETLQYVYFMTVEHILFTTWEVQLGNAVATTVYRVNNPYMQLIMALMTVCKV